jgi:thioredoxin 1
MNMSFSKVIHVNDQSISAAIKSAKISVVYFWASWCGPCKMMTSIYDELSNCAPEGALIVKADVDECPSASSDYKINSVPTFIFFKDGTEIRRIYGLVPLDSLLEEIQEISV